MKLAVLSDIHGNAAALEAALADLANAGGADETWVLGDLAAFGSQPEACIQRLRQLHEADKDHFKVIGGNTDRYLVTGERMRSKPAEDADSLAMLKLRLKLQSVGIDWSREQLSFESYTFLNQILHRELHTTVADFGRVIGYHAIPGDDEHNIDANSPEEEVLDTVLDRPARLGIYGHIHRRLQRRLGDFTLLNPGSVGLSFDQPGTAQYALLTFNDSGLSVDMRGVALDVDALVQELYAVGNPAAPMTEKLYREGL